MKKAYLEVPFGLLSIRPSRICMSRPTMIKNYRYATTSSPESLPKPKIPFRVKREPTDILKALASTVKRIPTEPEYKFYDDPYLYSFSFVEKNTTALSKESGKKAARYIRDNYSQYFNHHPDDPIIQEFAPKLHFDENSDVSEEDLCNCIRNLQVSDSEKVYRLCQAKNIEIGSETRQSLLELVSFYNGEDAIHPDWFAERNADAQLFLRQPVKSWNESGFAEELFESLKDDTKAEPYSALIKGMCKYYQAERAWLLFEECLGKGLSPDVGSFNAILSVSYLLRDDNIGRWTFITDLLNKMVGLNIRPNLRTMNGVLEALYNMRRSEETKNHALRVLAEFKQLNIKPSLASYFYLLSIFYVPRYGVKSFLPSLLNEIEYETFVIQDPRDMLFFCNAMEICKKELQSFEVADRLLKMVERGNNLDILGEEKRQKSFYQNYFILATDGLPLNELMELYNKWIPNFYSMDKEASTKIVQRIGVDDAVELLPRIWSDAVMLKQARSERLMETVLMVANRHNLEEASMQLKEQLINIAWFIWNDIQDTGADVKKGFRKKENVIDWSGQMLGDCIAVIVRCGDIEKVVTILRSVIETDVYVIGEIPIKVLKLCFDALVNEKMYSEAMMIIKYVKENEYAEASELVTELDKVPDLPESIKMRLQSSVENKVEERKTKDENLTLEIDDDKK